MTRYGGGEQGLARGRAATLAMLALPGSSYLYQGEELGLEQVDVAPEDRQDPSYLRTGEVGRDGCRVPIPWGGDEAPYAFGPGDGQPWIPQPADWASLTVDAQTGAEGSTLEFYRAALAARREFAWTAGDEVELLDLGADVLAFRRGPRHGRAQLRRDRQSSCPTGELLLSSGPVDDGKLPGDTAAWLR